MELQKIQQMIYEVRGVKVMLDKDLAELYQVTTGNSSSISQFAGLPSRPSASQLALRLADA